jgi:hypothetical protein
MPSSLDANPTTAAWVSPPAATAGVARVTLIGKNADVAGTGGFDYQQPATDRRRAKGVGVRKMVLAGAAVALAAALAITGAAMATTTGTEHFSFIDTSNTNSQTYSAIATGAFTAGGTAVLPAGKGTLRFGGGTIKVTVKLKGAPKTTSNLKACVYTFAESGTYTIVSGTGDYAGITGSGKFTLKGTAVGPIVKGKCSTKANTVGSQAIITASGPVSLP